MRQPFGSLLRVNLIAALLIFSIPPVSGQVAETAIAGVAFEGLSQSLNKKIKEAFDQGNFLVWHAGVQARLTLDRWKEVNKDLLDDAFSKIDTQHRDFFRNMNDLVSRLDATKADFTQDLQTALDQTQQIVSDIKFWDGQPVVLSYSPTLILLERSTPKGITIRGLNLDRANPEIELHIDGNKKIELKRTTLTRQEAVFEIPDGVFSSDDFLPKKISGQIILNHTRPKYLRLFGSETIEIASEMNLIVLPKYLGRLQGVETFKKATNRVMTEWKEREFHFSSGSPGTECRTFVQNPGQDKRIAVDTVQAVRGWGDHGSQSLASRTTEGFAVSVCARRYLHVRGFPPRVRTGPGYQHVIYRWREYTDVETVEKAQHEGTKVSWLRDELIRVAPGAQGFIATLALFTNEERKEIRERHDEKYYSVEYQRDVGAVLIRPKIPTRMSTIMN